MVCRSMALTVDQLMARGSVNCDKIENTENTQQLMKISNLGS